MDLVLIHLGGRPPTHIEDCVAQASQFIDGMIIVVSPVMKNFPETNVMTVSLNVLKETDSWRRFKNIAHFKNADLWRYACERFFVLESLMEFMNLDRCLHIENDNLIYGKLTVFDDNVWISEITNTLLSAGVMWVGSRDKLCQLNVKLNELMDHGHTWLMEQYGREMMNEMRMLKILSLENDFIELLPVLPDGSSGYVYDSASWGQYIGGTFHNPGESHREDVHIIGKAIKDNGYEVEWKKGCPYVAGQPLFNLHVHSKELSKWTITHRQTLG